MATLTAKLVLTSSDATTDTLSLSVTDTLTIEEPIVGPSRMAVGTTATALVASSISDATYIYIKHAGADTTFVTVHNDAGNNIAKLSVGEYMWLPIMDSTGIEVKSNTGTTVIEYAYWTKT